MQMQTDPSTLPGHLIRDGELADNPWVLVRDAATGLPAGDVVVPLDWFLANPDAVGHHQGRIGVWLENTTEPDDLDSRVTALPLIAVDFPVFADGRGLSLAVLLRTRLGYTGELRAIGDVQQDQLDYMRRCGFDAFLLRGDRDPEGALRALRWFTHYYQGSVPEPLPLFRSVQR